MGVLPGFAASNEIPGGQNITVILGSMRTIFTFTLTIDQTTRR